MAGAPETKKALIVVRTYPTPAKKGVEVSCTAAITDTGKWLRLFPVPYRFLDDDQRFHKYQWVEVGVIKANDGRPESYRLVHDSIRIVSEPLPTTDSWRARKDVAFPLKSQSLCELRRQYQVAKAPTLGLFRPKVIEKLIITPDDPDWTEAQKAVLRQGNLFEQGPQTELEKVPFSFKYKFRCDDPDCGGHMMTSTDWEMGASWRRWRDKYGDEWEEKFRQKYETEMIQKLDTHFFVGTIHQHPGTWIIVGLFYPLPEKIDPQPRLFG